MGLGICGLSEVLWTIAGKGCCPSEQRAAERCQRRAEDPAQGAQQGARQAEGLAASLTASEPPGGCAASGRRLEGSICARGGGQVGRARGSCSDSGAGVPAPDGCCAAQAGYAAPVA